ncbi:hypothetical protein B0H19DRAFT_1062765 [Mycena capillaripes]|nr:hypothetical protein B0H19DRAFT_1062765 [Mycena capillaripes]
MFRSKHLPETLLTTQEHYPVTQVILASYGKPVDTAETRYTGYCKYENRKNKQFHGWFNILLITEAAKVQLWDRFNKGEIRRMPQAWDRWGRTARNRPIFGTCILLVPQWAFRPEPVDDSVMSGPQKKKGIESRYRTAQELDGAMEGFVNADCSHKYLCTYFRPATNLDTYSSLNQEPHKLVESGWRSQATQLGSMSPASPTRAAFIPFMYKVPVPKEQRDDLVAALDAWQTTKQAQRAGGRSLLSKRVPLWKMKAVNFTSFPVLGASKSQVNGRLLVPWDLASQEDLKAVAMIIKDWRFDAQRAIGLTPRGGHRAKQQNTMPNPPHATGGAPLGNAPEIVQPSFSPARMHRGRPRGSRGRGRGAAQPSRVTDADFFATSASVPPRMMATRSSSGPHAVPLQPPASQPPPLPVSAPPYPTQPLPCNPYMTYYPAVHAYPSTGSSHPQMYPMYQLPPRYYPPGPNPQHQNP